jgi:DNA mismatch repair protein MutS2
VRIERAERQGNDEGFGGGTLTCDLRGERVDQALDLLADALDRAAADDCVGVRVIHGIGTGALRSAVRDFLKNSPNVDRFRAADRDAGGEGVTLAEFA